MFQRNQLIDLFEHLMSSCFREEGKINCVRQKKVPDQFKTNYQTHPSSRKLIYEEEKTVFPIQY